MMNNLFYLTDNACINGITNKTKMKKLILVLMIAQVILFWIGVCLLIQGDIERGIYAITISSLCFVATIFNLKQ